MVEDVQDHGGAQEGGDGLLEFGEAGGGFCFFQSPGTPEFDGHADGSVAQFFAFGGDAEDVTDEELWDVLFVVVMDL